MKIEPPKIFFDCDISTGIHTHNTILVVEQQSHNTVSKPKVSIFSTYFGPFCSSTILLEHSIESSDLVPTTTKTNEFFDDIKLISEDKYC